MVLLKVTRQKRRRRAAAAEGFWRSWSQVQLVNIATEEDCTHMPTMAPTLSSAPTLAPTLAPTIQSDAAPARAVLLPVVAALAAAVM